MSFEYKGFTDFERELLLEIIVINCYYLKLKNHYLLAKGVYHYFYLTHGLPDQVGQ